MPQEIQLFAGRQIRTYWDDAEEKYYFCIIDSIEALTDSKDPAGYFKKLRQRDSELDAFVRGTNCPPHQFISSDGKRHSPKCIDVQGLFRIIQSIPSKKAEPFKRWLAQVGADLIHQMQDPELGIQQSLADFKRLGTKLRSTEPAPADLFPCWPCECLRKTIETCKQPATIAIELPILCK